MRKLASSFLIITICILSFVMPFFKASQISYAAGDVSSWYQVTTTEQAAEAFRYYCKSRDLTIEGSALDAVTSFTSQTYRNLCNAVGLNMDAIQADLKYTTDQNGNIKYLFNATGISAMNRLFSQFLQDNELSVGDSVNDTVYDGDYGENNGNGFLVYLLPSDTTSSRIYTPILHGSTYMFTNQGMVDSAIANSNRFVFYPFAISSNNYLTVSQKSSRWRVSDASGIYKRISDTGSNFAYDGNLAIGKVSGQQGFRLGIYTSADDSFYDISSIDISSEPATVTIYSPTINNNTYEGNTYTTINNEGDTNNYYIDTEPDPDDPIGPDPGPDPGGGYDPYPGGGGTTTDPDQIGGGDGDDDTTVTFPNFNFDLPSINWSLGDLSEKFPFSIPFDLIAFFTVLNAEPEAPAIDANIPLGDWYTWNFQADFSQFDNYAVIIRNVEFIAFCVGLIYLTIKFVKG